MTDTEHHPEPWYWEADSEHCPHGPEPDDVADPAGWDEWMERHVWAPQDVRICLDAPVGDSCEVCSENAGEFVPWSGCTARPRVQAGAAQDAQHRPVTVEVAGLECLERECDEYFTDDGDEIPGKAKCSHFREMEVCEACSELPSDRFPAVVAWADCKHQPAATPAL